MRHRLFLAGLATLTLGACGSNSIKPETYFPQQQIQNKVERSSIEPTYNDEEIHTPTPIKREEGKLRKVIQEPTFYVNFPGAFGAQVTLEGSCLDAYKIDPLWVQGFLSASLGEAMAIIMLQGPARDTLLKMGKEHSRKKLEYLDSLLEPKSYSPFPNNGLK